MSPEPVQAPPRPRIAYLSYSTAQFDSRTQRMAASALDAGFDVTVYARWEPGLPFEEDGPGYRILRVPCNLWLVVPGLRWIGRRRVRRLRADPSAPRPRPAPRTGGAGGAGDPPTGRMTIPDRLRGTRLSPYLRAGRQALGLPGRSWRQLVIFPLRPIAWSVALAERAEPADIWHGMWAGSLPAGARLRGRLGGRSVYDSRDIYLHARSFDRMSRPARALYAWLERRWARSADAVLTVNAAYAEILERLLRIPRPPVVMNCPVRWQPPEPRPDLIRARLGLPATTRIVLYQGNLMTERGIEESMDAILGVPYAVLVLLGYGGLHDRLAAEVARPPYAGRVFLLDAVPPSALLTWTASADLLVMAIQPTTLNHLHTTPQKLFEALAAGVPVVASDLPGMAEVVKATEAGILCDPTSPPAIAAAIRAILEAPREERAAMRERALRAAHERYNWEAQVVTLFALYRDLLARGPDAARA